MTKGVFPVLSWPRRVIPAAKLGGRGFTMIEVLVTLTITMLGLLGVLALMVKSHQAEFESYQRAQALILLADVSDRLLANRATVSCYDMTGWPVKYLGPESTAVPYACVTGGTAETRGIANADLAAWRNSLLGSSEKIAGVAVGVLTSGRGCIKRIAGDSTGEIFEVAVAWEGQASTVAPLSDCAINLYSSEEKRRVVSKRVKIPTLGA